MDTPKDFNTTKLHTGTPWWLTIVYRPLSDTNKIVFKEVTGVRALPGMWLLYSDFNLVSTTTRTRTIVT